MWRFCGIEPRDDPFLDTTRHPAWNKIIALRKAIENKNRLRTMWVDADAVVMNHNISAEALIPQNVDMVCASDFNGLKSGVFMVRQMNSSVNSLEFGDFILHLGAMSNPRRIRILEEAQNWIVR